MLCQICREEHPQTTQRALTELSSTPRRLDKLLSRVSARQAASRPIPKKWSIKEIVSHLADCEIIYGFRYRKIIAEPGSDLAAFDQEVWADGLRYRGQNLQLSRDSFTALRRQNVALLKSAPKGSWSEACRHPEYGTVSLRELVVHLAYHDRKHLAQIQRLAGPIAARKRRKKKAKK
jgi:uncharacterized damage-inducible protein DinB